MRNMLIFQNEQDAAVVLDGLESSGMSVEATCGCIEFDNVEECKSAMFGEDCSAGAIILIEDPDQFKSACEWCDSRHEEFPMIHLELN